MADFNIAVDITLKHEGGFSNDPSDSGGKTKYGISQKAFPDIDIESLTIDDVKRIYQQEYWDRIQGDLILNQKIANKIFDIAVNCGVFTSSKYAQKAAIEVTKYIIAIDGHIGVKTIEVINQCNPAEFLDKFRKLILSYYESLNKPASLKGWKIRLFSE